MGQSWGAWAALVGASLLAGCVSLPEGKELPERYVLRPAPVDGESHASSARVRVAEPRVASGLDSDRIAVLRANRRLDHYAGARWAARLPKLVGDFLSESLERRYGAMALGSESARFRLVTAVRDFQAEYPVGSEEAPPRVRVRLTAELRDRVRSEVVMRQRIALTTRAEFNRLAPVVTALEGQMRAAADRILSRVDRHLTPK